MQGCHNKGLGFEVKAAPAASPIAKRGILFDRGEMRCVI